MLTYENPDLVVAPEKISSGVISWQSPSNLALVKYWGKHGRQLPRNPSVSFTLQSSRTETRLSYGPKHDDSRDISLKFFFDGAPAPAFRERLMRFLESISDIFPFLHQLELRIDSRNTFPHSTGIASSASAMSALALCLCELEEVFFKAKSRETFFRKASYIARLGSGSASRSVFGGAAIWGKTQGEQDSSDKYAIPFNEQLHPVFRDFHDSILIVNRGTKSVSSSAGHALMEDHAYAEARYAQAHAHMTEMLKALREGDLDTFGAITEREALTLHGLMMSSQTPYILLEPNSITLTRLVQNYREKTGHPVFFSFDAGPNLHLLYPKKVAGPVTEWIENELKPLCQHGQVIADQVGQGPSQLITT